MSVDCPHGSFGDRAGCPDCRLERIADLLERIAAALEEQNEREGYEAAIRAWKDGRGRHPDD